MSDLPENEAQFMTWLTEENRRREIAHLQAMRSRYETLIIVCCLLMAVWGVGLYIGYQMGVVPPDIAGVITATVYGGGAYLLWRIHQMRQNIMIRLKAERKRNDT